MHIPVHNLRGWPLASWPAPLCPARQRGPAALTFEAPQSCWLAGTPATDAPRRVCRASVRQVTVHSRAGGRCLAVVDEPLAVSSGG